MAFRGFINQLEHRSSLLGRTLSTLSLR